MKRQRSFQYNSMINTERYPIHMFVGESQGLLSQIYAPEAPMQACTLSSRIPSLLRIGRCPPNLAAV